MTWHVARAVSRTIKMPSADSNLSAEVFGENEDNEKISINDTDKTTNKNIHIPAWAGYNSLIGKGKNQQHCTKVGYMFCLLLHPQLMNGRLCLQF